MKRHFVTLALGLALISLTGCGGSGSKLSSKIDLHMLENPDEVKKIYDLVVTRMGDQVRAVDDIDITINDPAENRIQRADDVVNLWIRLDMLHASNPNMLQRYIYVSEVGGWQAPETLEVDLRGASNEEKENFVLEKSLWNFTEKVPCETLQKVLADALARKAEPGKFSRIYIHSVSINSEGYSVTIHANLATNEQKVNEYYQYDFNGKQTR